MAMVSKIITFIMKRSALTHWHFQSLLEELDSTYTDLPLHSAMRWLSCGKVLERFVSCFGAIKAFLAEKGQKYPELIDCETCVSSGHYGKPKRAHSQTA